jgi:pimeloyl-ACP methyl ester carboxylesterase
MRRVLFLLLSTIAMANSAFAVTFSVSFPLETRTDPATGRIVVYLVRVGARVSPMHKPADGFIEEDPQPIYGTYVPDMMPGTPVTIDDHATSFPVKLSELPAGKYRAQAVLDMHHDNSDWQREPGNLFSDVIFFDVPANAEANAKAPAVKFNLKLIVKERPIPDTKSVQIVQVRSKLLSDFRKRDVYLRAGVALPVEYNPNRAYPAVYEVPGYGGDHYMALYKATMRARRPRGSAAEEVARNTFWIFLDPEGPNGHTLFADSAVNGPCGKALVTELIPEIEKRFNLIAQPSARIVTGHSSGGWSSLWLATEYPDVFGACWSSSPDPVDLRRLELVDIYGGENLYVDANGKETPAAQFDGKVTMSTRQENGMEQVLGPGNDSAQQWDSWQAVWGNPDEHGFPKPMYDPISGKIDHEEAETYRKYDIADRLRKDPKRFAPIFREQIRIVVGDADTYYLNEAVHLLKDDLDRLDPPPPHNARPGYIKFAPGADHGSVMDSPAHRAWAAEMMEHLRKSGHVSATTQK